MPRLSGVVLSKDDPGRNRPRTGLDFCTADVGGVIFSDGSAAGDAASTTGPTAPTATLGSVVRRRGRPGPAIWWSGGDCCGADGAHDSIVHTTGATRHGDSALDWASLVPPAHEACGLHARRRRARYQLGPPDRRCAFCKRRQNRRGGWHLCGALSDQQPRRACRHGCARVDRQSCGHPSPYAEAKNACSRGSTWGPRGRRWCALNDVR